MMISFRLNKRNDNELILLLSKYENNNMSEFIRGVLRDSLLTSKSISNDNVEDPFATASNTDNVVEISRQVNKKTEINNTNSNCNSNKKESIKWNFPS